MVPRNFLPGTVVRLGMLLLLSAGLASCDQPSAEGLTLTMADNGATRVEFGMPRLLVHRAIDPEQISLIVSVNDDPVPMTDNGSGSWTGSLRLPQGSPVELSVLWRENVGLEPLTLAGFRRSIPSLDGNLALSISDDNYDVDGFDFDRDGMSNLAERVSGSSAFDPLDPAQGPVDVFFPAIDPADAPVIDGSYDDIWNEAQYVDINRQNLMIDNLMIAGDDTRSDGNAEFRWGGMHDGEYLYLFVFGEGANRQTPFGDSSQLFNDDALEIFWDGNNSKARRYDGVDDHQVVIPLLKFNDDVDDAEINRSGDDDSRYIPGVNAIQLAETAVDFAVCLCTREAHIWEIRIRLSDALIPVGEIIGFDIQLDDDRDGGERDAKWGWAHPSRGDEDVDFTWFDPSFMGTARLNPPG